MPLAEAKEWLDDYRWRKMGRLRLCEDDRGPRLDKGIYSSAFLGLARAKWASFNARYRILLDYIEKGNDSKDKFYGESVLAEIIAFQLLGKSLDLYKYSQQLYFTPLSLDFSSASSRGFDILIAEDYRDLNGHAHYYDGQYVKMPLVGIDVTLKKDLREKKKKLPYNFNLRIPVLIIPLSSIPGFRDYLERVRLLLSSGQINEHYLPGLSDNEIQSFSRQLIILLYKEVERVEGLLKSGLYPEAVKGDSSILKKLIAFKEGHLKLAIDKHTALSML